MVTADHDHTMAMNGYPKRGNPILGIVRDYATGEPARDADGKTYTTLVFGNGRTGRRCAADVDDARAQALDYHQEAGVRLSGEGAWRRRCEAVRGGGGVGAVQGDDREHEGVRA